MALGGGRKTLGIVLEILLDFGRGKFALLGRFLGCIGSASAFRGWRERTICSALFT